MLLNERQIYVVDTNVLVDYPELVPMVGKTRKKPENPTVDLSRAHIVIPSAVIRELSSFKKERSERGKAARMVLKQIRRFFSNHRCTMKRAYNFNSGVAYGEQVYSLLPVHKDFKESLPFCPSEDDMDGQIILATLVVMCRVSGLKIDGSEDPEKLLNLQADNVTLLTNDNGLASRAYERGVITSRYEHKYPDPYTGRREITVPVEVFEEFFKKRELSRELFEMFLPDELKLNPNEFVVMTLKDPTQYPEGFSPETTEYFEHVGRYSVKEDGLVPLRYASKFKVKPKNVGQAIYAEALMNPEFAAVVCTGPAGSGKTFMATVYGYNACLEGEYIGVTVVPCENHGKLGALPGDLNDKMDPDVQPFKNALRNYLLKENAKFRRELESLREHGMRERLEKAESGEEPEASLKTKLDRKVNTIWEQIFSNIPIENARGRDFSYELALYDEFQDQNISQADTLIKRIGQDGKIVITGDIWQIHAPYLDENTNGLVYASNLLKGNPSVVQICFTEEEVVRHPLVQMVAKRQKGQSGKEAILDETPEEGEELREEMPEETLRDDYLG